MCLKMSVTDLGTGTAGWVGGWVWKQHEHPSLKVVRDYGTPALETYAAQRTTRVGSNLENCLGYKMQKVNYRGLGRLQTQVSEFEFPASM